MTDVHDKEQASIDAIDRTELKDFNRLHIDDVIEYVNLGLRDIPGPIELYDRYLRQRWDYNDIDFSQDVLDWRESVSQAERDVFLQVSGGFHHGERNVEAELPAFMMGADEEDKVFISSHIEDEARHALFFDRFFREVVGIKGESITDVLDATYEFRAMTGANISGLLSYVTDDLVKDPFDVRSRVRYAAIYHLYIEGVSALSAMKILLGYCRNRDLLPGYYQGFTATCRDEARHVQYGMGFLQRSIKNDPSLAQEIYDVLEIILEMAQANTLDIDFSPLGLHAEELRRFNIVQLVRKLSDVGISVPDNLRNAIDNMQPEVSGG